MTTATTKDPSTIKYRAFLLRLWSAETPDQCWRASLEDPRTGQRIGFVCLEHLFAFLMEQAERDQKNMNGQDDRKEIDDAGE